MLLALGLVLGTASSAAAQDGPREGEALFGRLLGPDRAPLEGVTITVSAEGGAVVEEVQTDANGNWEVPLRQPGTYTVTIDQEALPAGLEVRDAARFAEQQKIVPAGRQVATLFPINEEGDTTVGGRGSSGGGGSPSFVDRLSQRLLNGVKLGLIIAMAAIGLSVIFGTTGLINFAHGELVTAGAVIAWMLNTSGPELHLIPAAIIAIAIGAVSGALFEVGLWRPLRPRRLGSFQKLAITIGVSLLLRHVLLIWFGGRNHGYRNYAIGTRLHWGPLSITPRDLTIMGLSALLLIGVALMLSRTRIGKAMRAVSDDIDLAESSGIDVRRVFLAVWMGGGALAATGGIFLGAIETVNYQMGFRLLLLMFAAVILGGLGTAYGAMLGSLVVGLVTEVSTLWVDPELKVVFALLALILVLLVRPQGILGSPERVG